MLLEALCELLGEYIPVQGMGEPLNNYEQVRTATRMMINPTLFGLKRSKVTISTVGIIPRILQVRIQPFQKLARREHLSFCTNSFCVS